MVASLPRGDEDVLDAVGPGAGEVHRAQVVGEPGGGVPQAGVDAGCRDGGGEEIAGPGAGGDADLPRVATKMSISPLAAGWLR